MKLFQIKLWIFYTVYIYIYIYIYKCWNILFQAILFTVGVAMVALVEGRPQRNNQPLFEAVRGAGYGGDPSLAKIIEEQRFNLGNGGKFGHAANQVKMQSCDF